MRGLSLQEARLRVPPTDGLAQPVCGGRRAGLSQAWRTGRGAVDWAGTAGPWDPGQRPATAGRGAIEGGRWEGALTTAHVASRFRGPVKSTPTLGNSRQASSSSLCTCTHSLGSHGNGDATAAAPGQTAPRFLTAGGAERGDSEGRGSRRRLRLSPTPA